MQALHLCGDMGQDTILCWNVPPLHHVVGHVEQAGDGVIGIVDRVNADDGVATAVGKTFVDGSADAGRRVGRVVRLVAAGEGVPGAPMVLAQWAVHGIFLAQYIKSRLDMSLVTAETISDVRPVETRFIISLVVVSARSHSRNSPTVQPLISA